MVKIKDAVCMESVVKHLQMLSMTKTFFDSTTQVCQKDALASKTIQSCQSATQHMPQALCLFESSGELKSKACKRAIKKLSRRFSFDARTVPLWDEMCTQDVEDLCKDVQYGHGQVHSCLRKVHNSIMNPQCLRLVKMVEANEALGYEINPEVSGKCANEQFVFCNDVAPEDGAVLDCLLGYIDHDAMTVGCVKALEKVKKFTVASTEGDGEVVPTVKVKTRLTKKEVDMYLNARQGDWLGGWGKLVLVITIAWASLVLAGITYFLIKRHMDGSMMIAVHRDLAC